MSETDPWVALYRAPFTAYSSDVHSSLAISGSEGAQLAVPVAEVVVNLLLFRSRACQGSTSPYG
eukprot:15980617-Heterocapsa_arctica.AAC.1